MHDCSEIQRCKICDSKNLVVFAHTATCKNCGVLLCYPYPKGDDELFQSGYRRDPEKDFEKIRNTKLKWHLNSGARNHYNFTDMALFCLDDEDRQRELNILDYGAGGGQFALIAKSLFPLSRIHTVDICDTLLLDQFRPLNQQIKFDQFASDPTRFDVIFMNDVFEHLSDPLGVLKTLRDKLSGNNGRIFIDTPCQFWLYPITRLFNKKVHTKLLRGTVDHDHQQIWSAASFAHVVRAAGLRSQKYIVTSEFTQPPEFYLDNMKITNPLIRLIGKCFYRIAPLIARNKIMAVLKPISADVVEQ